MKESVTFACPRCRVSVFNEVEKLHCNECGGEWPVVDGIPHFISEDKYWGEIDQKEMQRINCQIRTMHWREALERSCSVEVRKASRMMMNLDRANWHLFLPLPRESTVLDIGAGSGAISHAMAQIYDKVLAVEPVTERVEFMRQRFRQEGLNNITLIRSHAGQLPFLDGTIDLAILNGVLEWIPWSLLDGRPRQVQLRTLKTILGLLKPGGFLCVGIENRYALDLFLGANDPHADIPFVTILPRFLADLYSRWKTGQPYRNYIYSAAGYRRLFKQAGFSGVQIYCAIPSYNFPRLIIPFEDALLGYCSDQFYPYSANRSKRFLAKALRLTGIDKHLVYAFFVIGRKSDD